MKIKSPFGPRIYDSEGERRLAKFINDYWAGREQDPENTEWLVERFGQILSGVPPKKALALEKRGAERKTMRGIKGLHFLWPV